MRLSRLPHPARNASMTGSRAARMGRQQAAHHADEEGNNQTPRQELRSYLEVEHDLREILTEC